MQANIKPNLNIKNNINYLKKLNNVITNKKKLRGEMSLRRVDAFSHLPY